ncbi:MAG: signal peptidase I [Clostridia bacterium]|nr:signal peptidase I [Clostridia bacterium]NCC42342.1 signal peptidase I [Clostridia bacterium]
MKALKKIWGFVSVIIILLLALLAIALAGVRLFGLQPYSVLSGSMEPTYHTGSLIYVKDADPEDITEGQAITFVMDENLTVATHRVVRNDVTEKKFYTKGDANEYEDSNPVLYGNLIGTPVYTIPYLGYVSDFVMNSSGRYLVIAGVVVFIILMFTPDVLRAVSKEDDKKEKVSASERNPKSEDCA